MVALVAVAVFGTVGAYNAGTLLPYGGGYGSMMGGMMGSSGMMGFVGGGSLNASSMPNYCDRMMGYALGNYTR